MAILHISLAEINQPLPQDDASIARARLAQHHDRIIAAYDMGIHPELIALFDNTVIMGGAIGFAPLEDQDTLWDRLIDTLRNE